MRQTGLAILSCLLLTLAPMPGRAQANADRVYYTRQRQFLIPFEPETSDRRLKEVYLYVSEDQGQSWQRAGTASPDQQGFSFRADRDGLFAFAVQTLDLQGKLFPPSVVGLQPSLRVHVDSQKPQIQLRAAPPRDGAVGVEWEIRDETIDLTTFNLEFRPAGAPEWTAVGGQPLATGVRYWNAGSAQNVEVRLRVRDLAKNEDEAKLSTSPAGGEFRAGSLPQDPDPNAPTRRDAPQLRHVRSRHISLNYEIKEQGPSGISAVELWVTRDGRDWEKYSEQKNPTPPYTFQVNDEGLYGFTLVVRNGVDESDRPPRTGDTPQAWVEVDLTKPVVEWVNADVGRGLERGTVTITWKAGDKHLSREPITLSYRDPKDNEWKTIATGLANTGRYVWRMPPSGLPYQFHVRVEAKDKAGNVGSLDYGKIVKVDLSRPKGVILNVEPVLSGGEKSKPPDPHDP